MKKFLIIPGLLLSLVGTVYGQLTAEQRIQDSVIGWWDNKKYDNQLKPSKDLIQRKRIQIDDSLLAWVMRSYTPVGGLGTYTRQNFPGRFGLFLAVWNVSHEKMWTDAQGHFRPIPEEATPFGIQANVLPAVTAMDFLNGKGDYYFTWPPDGYMVPEEAKRRAGSDFKNHPNVNPFITRITNRQNCVILSPGNRMPFVEVTIGEVLEKAEASQAGEKQKEQERIRAQWPGSDPGAAAARQEANSFLEKKFEACIRRIQHWKQVYRDRLSEPATFSGSHQTLLMAFNDDQIDPFRVTPIERERGEYGLVYKIPASLVEKCNSAQPQWLTAWWTFQTPQDGNQLYEMSRSMTEHINYTYLYNYFFDTAKIKGKPYRPSAEGELKARLDAYRRKNAVSLAAGEQVNSSDPRIHFQDDFSSGQPGSDPLNWYFNKSGRHSVVATVSGEPGNWLSLGFNNEVMPSLLKKPFPRDFTLEFDLVTSDFSGRYGGSISLTLSTWQPNDNGMIVRKGDGAQLTLDLGAGSENDFTNNNYSGMARLQLSKTPEVNTENNSGGATGQYELREFTNRKRKLHVALSVKQGQLSLSANGKVVITAKEMKRAYGSDCTDCSIPLNLLFNHLFLKSTTDRPDETRVYIGNIKITKG